MQSVKLFYCFGFAALRLCSSHALHNVGMEQSKNPPQWPLIHLRANWPRLIKTDIQFTDSVSVLSLAHTLKPRFNIMMVVSNGFFPMRLDSLHRSGSIRLRLCAFAAAEAEKGL